MIQRIKSSFHNRKGFTLIELIVVIAIIAILAAVLIPRFTGFTESARQKAAVSDTRNILIAVEALLAEGDPSITILEINAYTGKPFPGTIATLPLTTDTFTYSVTDGETYVVAVTSGEIDTSFEDPTASGASGSTSTGLS